MKKKKYQKKKKNEGERTTTETKTYLSQVTEGQKQRVTLEACDRAGSGKTCGKIQTRPPPVHPRREGREEEEEEKEGEKENNKGPGRIRYASGQIGRQMTAGGGGGGGKGRSRELGEEGSEARMERRGKEEGN